LYNKEKYTIKLINKNQKNKPNHIKYRIRRIDRNRSNNLSLNKKFKKRQIKKFLKIFKINPKDEFFKTNSLKEMVNK